MKKHGEFELYFVNEEGEFDSSIDGFMWILTDRFIAADAFQDVFSGGSDEGDSVQVIEMSGANGPGPSDGSSGSS